MNFPIRSFYSEVYNEIYTLYRQGNCVTVNAYDTYEFKQQKFPLQDMNSMYLIFDEALMIRSSDSIVFFKLMGEEELNWTEYHRLPKMRGQIYFIKGNVRI